MDGTGDFTLNVCVCACVRACVCVSTLISARVCTLVLFIDTVWMQHKTMGGWEGSSTTPEQQQMLLQKWLK